MALSTYAELQTAIATELDRTGNSTFVSSVPDFITRCEAKLNRRLRLREMEQLTVATYAAGTTALEDRLVKLPTDYVEMIDLRAKLATDADDKFEEVEYVAPQLIHTKYTTSTSGKMYYTLRRQIEINRAVSADHELMLHYFKRWDIATDSTNWLLTNYPDVYLYGSLVEGEMFMMDDQRTPYWRSMFEQGIKELNLLSERGRDDAILDTSQVMLLGSRSGTFDITTG